VVGGSLLDNNGGAATPLNYADDTVVNGTLGFGATVGTLTSGEHQGPGRHCAAGYR
jgi:hypothetical protein